MLRSVRKALRRFTGGLRFRLTLTYVVFFSVLLGFLGLFFRETISRLYDDQYKNLLNEEVGAVRGYLRIEKPKRKGRAHEINWYYDRYDPEEALIVDRLRQVYMIADAAGNPVEMSPRYPQLPLAPPDQIRAGI